mgnify:FL=1
MARTASSAALKAVPKEESLGSLIDALEANRIARRPIEKQLAVLEDESKEIKKRIIDLMDSDGAVKAGTERATVSISEIERVVVQDTEAMLKALKRDGFLHILDLKVAAAKEYKELKGKEIPGTETQVVRRQLNHTSLNK